ncbi:MAG: cupin domain-containing protein [Myxococcota bacterium]
MTTEISNAIGPWLSGHVSDVDWQPFQYMENGTPFTFGEFIPLRMEGTGGYTLAVGLWRVSEPSTSPPYTSELGDETFLVLEGEVEIEIEGEPKRRRYGAGDYVSWSMGTPTTWHIVQAPFKKFFVVARPEKAP